MEKIRLAMIGSRLGANLHLGNLAGLRGHKVDVAAVASGSMESAGAGKYIICEKPLTGYFGKDRKEEQVGTAVRKEEMLQDALRGCDQVREVLRKNRVKFMYAENWIYAPPLVKLKRLMKASGGTILEIRAEQGHSGSAA
jgi:predicted dehydrogenase